MDEMIIKMIQERIARFDKLADEAIAKHAYTLWSIYSLQARTLHDVVVDIEQLY